MRVGAAGEVGGLGEGGIETVDRTTSLVVSSSSPSVKHAEMSTALSSGTNAPSDGS
jgi:hypothetical protein